MTFVATPRVADDNSSIARRRRRLIIDYQDLTHTWLDAHRDDSCGAGRVISKCFASARRQFLPHYFGNPPRWRVWIRQLRKDRVLPDFCVVGPGKSGTSDLAVTIMSHPNVLYPMVKEFPSTYPPSWRPFYPTRRAVQRHARRVGVALCPFVGPYLHSLDIPITLSALRPDIKVIIALRNPVDLMFSLWKWSVLHNGKQLSDSVPYLATFPAYVDKALELFPENPFGMVLSFGIYASSVAHWHRAFGEGNVHVLDVADYFRDRSVAIRRLEHFLGLPDVPLPPQLPVVNRNPLDAFSSDPHASAKLTHFFGPYNRQLWSVIGTEYSW